MTTVASEFGTDDASLSPAIAVYAMLIITPLQFIFELLCVMLARMKVLNRDSTWEGLRLLLCQCLVTGILVYIVA